jgi:hypothetical protein
MNNTELIVGVVVGVVAFLLLCLLILIGIIVRSVASFTVFSLASSSGQ